MATDFIPIHWRLINMSQLYQKPIDFQVLMYESTSNFVKYRAQMLFTTSFAVNVIFFCRLNNCLILIRSFSFTKFKSKSTSQANSVTHPYNQT